MQQLPSNWSEKFEKIGFSYTIPSLECGKNELIKKFSEFLEKERLQAKNDHSFGIYFKLKKFCCSVPLSIPVYFHLKVYWFDFFDTYSICDVSLFLNWCEHRKGILLSAKDETIMLVAWQNLISVHEIWFCFVLFCLMDTHTFKRFLPFSLRLLSIQ